MDKLHRIRMLMGDKAIERLQNATVMVVGCGAVGSFAIEALARSGVGHIILVDFDRVAASNINRQLFAMESTIGRLKTDVARERIADINRDIIVDAYPIFFDSDTNLDVTPDFIIDAIDTAESKIAIYKWATAHNIPFIASMGAARKTDPTQIRIAMINQTSVCPLAAKIRRMARDENIPAFPVVFSPEPPSGEIAAGEFGSIITVTGAVGLLLANAAIRHIASNVATTDC